MKPYLKSIVGGLIAGLSVVLAALDDNVITEREWVSAVVATLVGLGGVFLVPNKDPQATHQAESVQPPTAGRNKHHKDSQWG